MRSVCYYSLISAGLSVILLSSCDSGGCGSGGTSMFCAPAATGFAQVNGLALRSDGSPVVQALTFVYCGGEVSAMNDRTDTDGRFETSLTYNVADTTLYPYPPRAADGSFALSCRGGVVGNDHLVQDPLLVRFAPTPGGVVPTVVELREPAP
jgi:hypothetical protein